MSQEVKKAVKKEQKKQKKMPLLTAEMSAPKLAPASAEATVQEVLTKPHKGRKTWNYRREHIQSVTTTVRIPVDMRELLERYLNEHEVILSVAVGRAFRLLFINEGWVKE